MRMTLPFGPHWYAAVMGTGIVALALEGLPFSAPGAHALAVAFWLAAAVLLVAVSAVLVAELRHDLSLLGRYYDDPAAAPSFGAVAMALLTVGAGALGTGSGVLGDSVALWTDGVLWLTGTLLGLLTAVAVPYAAITRHRVDDDSATGSWLMPVVPPLVSASAGAALVPHLPRGQAQETLLLACYAFFGLSVVAGFLVLNQLWQRLIRHGSPPAATLPSVWIALGFLGQSTVAVHHLGALAPALVPGYGDALGELALVYGVPVWGFTLLWVALAAALTIRQVRAGLPFAPSWWSFTFPVGNVALATSALAGATGLAVFEVVAGLFLLGLLGGWTVASIGTARALIGRREAAGVTGATQPVPVSLSLPAGASRRG
ncbi:C4-dicarboxylate ABC transporter [Nocardioides sp. BP30]|uniref:SLAC1 family transporter n=1 Tax=Nocardioides sp. BP30 TaxID=3036374 RepID=UPI002468F6B9|nr:C4-dicarboxylate ABC transporter [Nocardioides sp. BP30]WGL50562.1 C4-dicarboxylate ABC transporter [Nocardioides sp. BP30]